MDEIENRIITCFMNLNNPFQIDPMQSTRELQILYENPSSIPVLFNIYSKNESIFLKKSTAIGLKRCISHCSEKICQEDLTIIFLRILNIIYLEGNSEIINTLLLPLEKMYEICGGKYEFIENFINLLIQNNQIDKCITILITIIPITKDIEGNIEKLINILIFCLGTPLNVNIIYKYFQVYLSLINYLNFLHIELPGNILNNLLIIFSNLYLETLKQGSTEEIEKVCNIIIKTYENDIEPILFDRIFEMSILYLQSQYNIIQNKINVIEVLGYSLFNTNIELNNEILINLLDLILNLTIISFNEFIIKEIEYIPTKFILIAILQRIPNIIFHDVIEERIEKLIQPTNPSTYFTGILLIQISLRTHSNLIIDLKERLLFYCISSFNINNELIRSLSCHTIKTCYFSLSEQINSKLEDIIIKIIDMIQREHFVEGLILIPNILYDIEDIDPIFEILINICNLYINDLEICTNSWLILTILTIRSRNKICEYFEEIYRISYEFLQKDNEIQRGNALRVICSLSRNCHELFQDKIHEIKNILIKWYLSEDIILEQDSIFGFIKLIKYYPTEIEELLPNILPKIFHNCSQDYTEELILKLQNEENINEICNYIDYIIKNDLKLLSIIIKKYPPYFLKQENIIIVFSCLFKSYKSIFNNIFIESNKLFCSIIRLNIPNFTHIYVNMLLSNLKFLEESEDILLETSSIKTFNVSYQYLGKIIFNNKEKYFLELIFLLLEQQRNNIIDEYLIIKFHQEINEILNNILRSIEINETFFEHFIPKLYELIHSKYETEQIICFNISMNIIKYLPTPFLDELYHISIRNISSDEIKYCQTYVTFLMKLIETFPNGFQHNNEILQIIVQRINNLKGMNKTEIIIREYLLALFSRIDEIVNITNEQIILWYSNFLPITITFEVSHIIYGYIIRHFPEYKTQLFHTIVEPFYPNNIQLLKHLMESPQLMKEMYQYVCNFITEISSTELLNLFNGSIETISKLQNILNEIGQILTQQLTQNIPI